MTKKKTRNNQEIFVFPNPMEKMKMTGERYVSSITGNIQNEHYHRYLFALDFCRDKNVLDVACGEGYGCNLISQVASGVVGVDVDADTVAYADRTYGTSVLRFVAADATQLPFDDASFDVVTSFETIEHFDGHEAFLAEIARVLRPGGTVVISSPNRTVYTEQNDHHNPFHVRELDREQFLSALGTQFSNVITLNQRAIYGSVLAVDAVPAAIVGYESQDGRAFRLQDGVPSTHYFVAVASNGPLPEVKSSLLFNRPDNQDEAAQTNAKHHVPDQQMRSAEAVHADITKLRNAFSERAQKARRIEELKLGWAWRTVSAFRELGCALRRTGKSSFAANAAALLRYPTRSERRKAYRQAKILGTSPNQPRKAKAKSRAQTNIKAILRHPFSRSARRAYRGGQRGANSPFALAGKANEIGAIQARRISDSTNPIIAIPFHPRSGQNAFDRIAVIAHVFYPDIFDSMMIYIRNIHHPIGLFISTDCEEKRKKILDAIPKNVDFLEIDVRVVPNRGRDIAPQLIAFRDVYKKYPIFLHIHSKKSLHAGNSYIEWRDYLLTSLAGSPEIVSSNLDLLSDPKVGVVYPEHAEFVKSAINWGYDFDLAKDLLQKAGVKLNANHTLEFPSGSMYWARSAALSKLLDLELDWLDFPDDQGQVDGTLAHAIERSILFFVEASGYKWKRTRLQSLAAKRRPKDPLFRPLLTSDQDYLPAVAIAVPESERITTVISDTSGPRLNLLVPSLNSADIFGGIDTALKVFLELATAHPAADCRILVTDAHVNETLPERLQAYEIQKIGHEERKSKVVVDCKDRAFNPLELTHEDVFVATAWWTAINAYRMQENQKILFGKHNRVIYLIQDYEPGFYAWSTRYSLADSTYRKPDDTLAIFNSEELTDFMLKRHKFPHKWVLPYRPNDGVAAALETVQRERILLFYSRPSATRNCFEAGIDGIGRWARRNPTLAAKWKIYCIGETFPSHLAEHLGSVEITGKMPLDAYAALLSRASVGVSLMVSPHPSYPPLEMAYAGIFTITNNYESKDLSKRSDNIIGLTELTSETIADAIEHTIDRAEKNIGKITPIKCTINDLPSDAPKFSAEDVLGKLNIVHG
ncbi:rhamnan synthesis F family protein [Aminobacter sp. UC22_36]|uniref:rhamnosyltransferase WsaF family glycosyltransferase n=1 Tax=Aminobacter sp. UC22_36 TaxID=3374549 RepID=UPI003756998F